MLEDILKHLSFWRVLILALVLIPTYVVSKRLNEDRRIRALGARAARAPTRLPLDIDFVQRAVASAFSHTTLESWSGWFATCRSHTFEARPAGLRVIFTEDPTNIKAILASQFQDYGKGEPFKRDWHDFLGDSIFTTDLEQWHDSRQLIRPLFNKERVSDLENFEKHMETLLKKMGESEEVDVADLFFRYTLDAATAFLLGESVGSLDNPQVKFAEAFAEVQRWQAIIARAAQFKTLVPRAAFRRHLKTLNEFVNPYIERALLLPPSELEAKSKSSTDYTFLHALAAFTRDRTVLRDQLVAVLLAGRDTTAATLSWTLYELSRHPGIVRKLRQEIIDVVGLDTPPTYAHLKSMRYLQHVMNETLRLYPVVPFNVRLALHDTTLPTGGGPDGLQPIGVLKDTPIGYSTLCMQRRPDIYPPPSATFPPVLDFAPERWEHWTPKSWTYIPFNGGPRICIGQQFALTEMGYTLVRILQRFVGLEVGKSAEPEVKLRADIVLQPAGTVMVSFIGRKGEDRS